MEENKELPKRARPVLSPYLEEKLPRWEKRYGFLLAAVFGLIVTSVGRERRLKKAMANS